MTKLDCDQRVTTRNLQVAEQDLRDPSGTESHTSGSYR